ncbi:rab GTPase-binding effector protein 1 isoform X2 [Calliphora vicina]|uniref:rab GTPase-binding effector protein 1 isoform X2 n=1 Tax=Calliphora vicina TaxID=7373 RepID=UPI00325BA014
MEESDFNNKQTSGADVSELSKSNAAGESGSGSDTSADLLQKIRQLEEENRKMQYGFNSQRAKLKELFVQKERELDELKTKMIVAEVKAQEEISSLQQLVQETIEESAICKSELEHLKGEAVRYRQLNESLMQHQQTNSNSSQELSSLAPQVLSQVKKTIVRKFGVETTNSVLGTSFGQENSIEESKNKNDGKYTHEDSEVLSSIVTQLQEEMKALKEKLREADEKLRASQIEITNSDTISNCSNCAKLEEKLEELKTNAAEKQEEFENIKKQLDESVKDLEKEAALRAGLENQWQEKREAHKNEVHILREQVTSNEQQLLELQQKFLETKDEVMRQLQRVSDDREKVNKHLETLQADNDFLSGRYLATAEEIENQYINLPNTVEELHEVILRQQNELIQARLGCDFEKNRCVTSLDEIQILRDQLDASNNERIQNRKKYQTETKSFQDRITQHLVTLQNCEEAKTALERKESELNRQISEFRVEIIELQEQNEKLSRNYADAKAKIKNLQDDLATSEQVQKDFVQLSQTLQNTISGDIGTTEAC